jgi:hypothetical protein
MALRAIIPIDTLDTFILVTMPIHAAGSSLREREVLGFAAFAKINRAFEHVVKKVVVVPHLDDRSGGVALPALAIPIALRQRHACLYFDLAFAIDASALFALCASQMGAVGVRVALGYRKRAPILIWVVIRARVPRRARLFLASPGRATGAARLRPSGAHADASGGANAPLRLGIYAGWRANPCNVALPIHLGPRGT